MCVQAHTVHTNREGKRERKTEERKKHLREREEQLKKVEKWEGIRVVLLQELEVCVCNFQLFAFDLKCNRGFAEHYEGLWMEWI